MTIKCGAFFWDHMFDVLVGGDIDLGCHYLWIDWKTARGELEYDETKWYDGTPKQQSAREDEP